MNIILFLGILLVLGLASTRVMKIFKLPNVTGYLIIGLLSAIVCVIIDNYTNSKLADSLDSINVVVSDIALGFIALSIGEEFSLKKLKKLGGKIITITLFQALTTVAVVDIVLAIFCAIANLPMNIALCLGAIATATAPAATLMVIHQYNAKGPLVDILLPVVAFDDAVGLIVFSISVSISKVMVSGTGVNLVSLVALPLLEIIGSIGIGFILGFLLHVVIKYFKSRHNHVIAIIAFTLIGVGVIDLINMFSINGETLEFSSLLCCMMIGAVYNNMAHRKEDVEIIERDFSLVDRWTPFLFMLFFVLSGTHLVTSFKSMIDNSVNLYLVLGIFIAYLLARSCGKYTGAFIGCKITRQSNEITKYLGLTLFPQAGVAIGMANQISSIEAFKANNTGYIIVTCVLCATLVYELIGPLLTKWALIKSHEIENIEDNKIEKQ